MLNLLTPEVISALIQVPLVLAFIIFTLEMLKRFINWQGKQNEVWQAFMEKTEDTNREFLREQRNAYGSMVENVVLAISSLTAKVGEHNAILTEHDRKLDTAVADMRARVEKKE